MVYIHEDPDAIYYKGDFATEEERVAAGAELVKQVEADGYLSLVGKGHDSLPLWMEQPLFFLSVY